MLQCATAITRRQAAVILLGDMSKCGSLQNCSGHWHTAFRYLIISPRMWRHSPVKSHSRCGGTFRNNQRTSKTLAPSTALHNVTPQKTVLFIVTVESYEGSPTFRRDVLSPTAASKSKLSKNKSSRLRQLAGCIIFSSTLKMEALSSSKHWWASTGLHGVISKKIKLFVAHVKKMWIYTSTPPYVFMADCLITWAQGQLYLTDVSTCVYTTTKFLWSIFPYYKFRTLSAKWHASRDLMQLRPYAERLPFL
jgi:hypothetical protein